MRYLTALFAIILLIIFMWRCGGDPLAAGDKAYNDGNYDEALKNYFEAKKNQPQNQLINEKIALSYAQRGLSLYNRAKNVASFVGNFEKGREYIPQEKSSAAFNKEYSRLLYELAKAHHKTKPENPLQEEQYFAKTLSYLDEALLLDYENEQADSLLAAIREANFQKMFDKGMKFLNQGKKEKGNPELFVSADFYLNRAVSFDPTNAEAQKYLKEVRQKLLNILDLNTDFPMAIVHKKYTANHLLLDISALNNLGETMNFDPVKLKIVDLENNEYGVDPQETQKYENALTKVIPVENRKTLDGNVAFKISPTLPLSYLKYELDTGKISKKYFP